MTKQKRCHGREQRAHAPASPGETRLVVPDSVLQSLGMSRRSFDEWSRCGLLNSTIDQTGAVAIEVGDATRLRSLCAGDPVLRRTLDRLRERSTDALRRVTLDEKNDAFGPSRIGPKTAGEWHELGVCQTTRGETDRAIESYRRALAAGEPNAQIVFDLAHALAESGRTESAIERYLQVTEIDPRREDAWVNLGDLYLMVGEIGPAVEALRRALDLAPDDAAAHYNLADALDRLGNPAAAVLHYHAFARLAEEDSEQLAYARRRVGQMLSSDA